ncbi:GHKL domain-containing protein [candidate division KSB1 bacterium]|nr:GHKL domain-containing protein [candidate division KSB1 bacterium]RQW04375.1 MAG: GHKL domain-containing protein [candidate division KSB1 bacterium]
MTKRPINKFIIIIILALFVPILTYTIYQFVQLDENEQLIQSIYDRQLETIIFSVNQWSYDIVTNWYSEMTSVAMTDFENLMELHYEPMIKKLPEQQEVIAAAFLRFSPEFYQIGFSDRYQTTNPKRRELINKTNQVIAENSESLANAIKFVKDGYVRPLSIDWTSKQFEYTLLIFPILNDEFPGNGAIYGGLLIDNIAFINRFVERHFNALTNGEFDFAVQKKGHNDFFYYSTEEKPIGPFEQSEPLWILADMELKIKMSGTTLNRIVRERSRYNLISLILVNVVFIVGLVYVIRNVWKEMELAKIKSNLVANVSHEIRTPVALIRMYAETLEMGRIVDEGKKNKYYKTILAETVRLTHLINNMLDFSKIESKKKEYRMSMNDMRAILKHVLDMYHYNFEQQGFHIEQHIADDLPHIYVDSEAVTQATINLLDNAMKYSQEEKRIAVTLAQQGQHIVLSVKDHGIGIPESEHKKIFEKFYRVGDSLVHDTKGSGLGLSLVAHIMKVHNGKVTLKSKPGQGSTFSLIFPISHLSGV